MDELREFETAEVMKVLQCVGCHYSFEVNRNCNLRVCASCNRHFNEAVRNLRMDGNDNPTKEELLREFRKEKAPYRISDHKAVIREIETARSLSI